MLEDGKLIGGIGIPGGHYSPDQNAYEVALKELGFEIQSSGAWLFMSSSERCRERSIALS